jgi:hypothetical protein
MARLNDPPAAATESVDALKRRFLRQNRDLAKTNSIQSVRIRCLESEVSRLLAENLELREEILQLRNILDSSPSNPIVTDSLHERLESKLQEINGLVSELRSMSKSKAVTKIQRDEPLRRPERNIDSEGILPIITEDKQWPRLSLEYEFDSKFGKPVN